MVDEFGVPVCDYKYFEFNTPLRFKVNRAFEALTVIMNAGGEALEKLKPKKEPDPITESAEFESRRNTALMRPRQRPSVLVG